MGGIDVEIRSVPAQRVATLTRPAAGPGSEHIGPVVGPMFAEAAERLAAAGVASGTPVAVYAFEQDGVRITAGFVVEDGTATVDGLEVQVRPAIERAAVTVHSGDMATIDRSWRALMDAAAERGETLLRNCREISPTSDDVPREAWRTQLVQPLGADPAAAPAR